MRLVRDLKELKDKQPNILVLTGNGKTESRILAALCEKYDGKEKFLWFPETPIRRRLKETGFKAFNAIKICLAKYRLGKFLFLIDREHFKEVRQGREQEEVSRYMEKRLKARIETTCELVSEKAFITRGYLGSYPFDVCTVIFGVTSKIEEEISELIRLKLKVQVKPDKPSIDRFLKSRRKKVESLIKEASKKYLEEAFPGLCNALKAIEN